MFVLLLVVLALGNSGVDAGSPNGYPRCSCNAAPSVCDLPINSGPCEAAIPRWGYDAALSLCRPFTYGGCDGNGNNFGSFEECRESCQTCGATDACPPCENGYKLDARGCPGCECKALCDLEQDPGRCRAAIPRFFHNPRNRFCEPFTYGGCDGNANNFETLDACFAACDPCPVVDCVPFFDNCQLGYANDARGCQTCDCLEKDELCSLPVVPGPCTDYALHYYYNPVTGSCEPFIYGGCAANANNFRTEERCREVCM